MKTSKALALASGLSIALISATAFAGTNEHSEHTNDGVGNGKKVINRVTQMQQRFGSGMHMGSGAMMASGMHMGDHDARFGSGMHMGSGAHRPGEGMAFSGLLRTDLAADETAALKVILDGHKNEVQALFASGSTLTKEERQTKLNALHTAFINSLLPYVMADKQEEFKTKFAEMKTPEDRQEMRGQRQEVRQEMREQRQENRQEARAERQSTKMDASINKILDTKLAKFSTDAEKLAWLGNISTKVDAVLAKISSAKTRATLQALKDIVGERVDALNGTTSESVLESVLQ